MAYFETFANPRTEQVMAYKGLREELERAYTGRWVIIHDSQCVGDYGSFHDAMAEAEKMGIDVLDCYIRQVGVETPIIISYGR